jgi:formylmethanofuran dehydrogenase subunit E-like metal-binding protein
MKQTEKNTELDYFYLSSPTIRTFANSIHDLSIYRTVEITLTLIKGSSIYGENVMIKIRMKEETTLEEIISEAKNQITKEIQKRENRIFRNTTDLENLFEELEGEIKNHMRLDALDELKRLANGGYSNLETYLKRLIALSKDDAELFHRFIEEDLEADLEMLEAKENEKIRLLMGTKLRVA